MLYCSMTGPPEPEDTFLISKPQAIRRNYEKIERLAIHFRAKLPLGRIHFLAVYVLPVD